MGKQITSRVEKSHIYCSISTLQAWHKDSTAVLSKYQIPLCIALIHAFLNFLFTLKLIHIEFSSLNVISNVLYF